MKIEPLFNRNIIINKSDNIIFEINKPNFEKNVFKLDREYEKTSGYYTILYVNNEYKLYYKSCPYPYYKDKTNKTYYGTEELAIHEYFCLATSKDGLNFEKKNYNIIDYNNSCDNNILIHDFFCHNFNPFYDKKNNKYLAIAGTSYYGEGMNLFVSFDGIDWIYIKKILDESYLVPEWCHPNHFDSHNCIVYNEKEDYYYIYLRNNKLNQRFVQYTKTKDFNNFDKCHNINIYDNNHIVLYTPGIFKYENSDYFLGIPTVNGTNYDSKNNSTLMISQDGINFNILTKELFNENNETIMNISSIVPSHDNSKMYIYSHCNLTEDEYISCHSFEKNRIQKIVCNGNGFIKTDLINLHDLLTVNYETFEEGYLNIQFINKMNEIIFNSENISGNYYDYKIEWNKNNEEYYIQFNMYNCNLYSFSY
jgi:hypothetical protein